MNINITTERETSASYRMEHQRTAVPGREDGGGRGGAGGWIWERGTKNEERTASKRVSHSDRAAVHVDFLVWDADCVNGVNSLAGERLVDLEEVDVLCDNAHVSVDEAKERKKESVM